MPQFCHFWRMTPAEFKRLSLGDYKRMTDYMQRYLKTQQQG